VDLADILGHSSIGTTRTYTRTSSQEKKINEFRINLYNLYNNITSWLKEYIASGQIVIKTDRAFIFEDHLEYKLPSLQITLGHKEIWLNPRGVNFKGEGGYMDMNG
jgi:hypothetical protein